MRSKKIYKTVGRNKDEMLLETYMNSLTVNGITDSREQEIWHDWWEGAKEAKRMCKQYNGRTFYDDLDITTLKGFIGHTIDLLLNEPDKDKRKVQVERLIQLLGLKNRPIAVLPGINFTYIE